MADNKYKFTDNGYTDLNNIKSSKPKVEEPFDSSLTGDDEFDLVKKSRAHQSSVSNPFLQGNKNPNQKQDFGQAMRTKEFEKAKKELADSKQKLAALGEYDKQQRVILEADIKKNEKIINDYARGMLNRNAFSKAMNDKANKLANKNYTQEHIYAYQQAKDSLSKERQATIEELDKRATKLQEEIAELEKKRDAQQNEGRVINPYQYNSYDRQIKEKQQRIEKIEKEMKDDTEFQNRQQEYNKAIEHEQKLNEEYQKKNQQTPYRVVGGISNKINQVNDKATDVVVKASTEPAKKVGEAISNTKPVQAIKNSKTLNVIKDSTSASWNNFKRNLGGMRNKIGKGVKKFAEAIFNICKSIATFLFSNPIGWVCLAVIVVFNLLILLAVGESVPDVINKDDAAIEQQINAHAEQDDITQLKAFKARVESKMCHYENEDTENETYVCDSYIPEGSTKTYTTQFYDNYHLVVSSSNVVPIIWTWKSDKLWKEAEKEEADKLNDSLKPADDGYVGTKQYWINVVNSYWDKVGLNEKELKSLFVKRVDYKYQYLNVNWGGWSSVPQNQDDAYEKDSDALANYNQSVVDNYDQYKEVTGTCYWGEEIEHEAETAERTITQEELSEKCKGKTGKALKTCRANHRNDKVTYTTKEAYTETKINYETCTYYSGRKATKISWTQDQTKATAIFNTVDKDGATIHVTGRTQFINWDGKADGNWFLEYQGTRQGAQSDSGNFSVKRIKTFKSWTKEEVYYLLTHEYYPNTDYITMVSATWNNADSITISDDTSGNPDDHPFPEGFDKGDSTYFGEKEINYTPLETDEGIEAHDLNPTGIVDNYIYSYTVDKHHIYVDWYNDDNIIPENYWKANSLASFEKDLRAYYEILASLGHDINVAFLEGKIFISPFYTACQIDDDSKIASTISQHFGATGTVSTEFSGQDNHGAIDFTDAGVANACNIGQGWQINASQSGKVVGLKNDDCYNSGSDTACYVKIQSEVEAADGKTYYIEHWYWHVAEGSVTVSMGDEVKAGEEIATVGNTGYSTGPHVHFETAIWSEQPAWWGTATDYATYKENIFDPEELIQFSNSDIGSTDDMETNLPE